jgi:trk system potassium uptake protein TrkH
MFILVFSALLISLDGHSFETNISSVVSCFNNIGPGFAATGPTCNYASFSVLSKCVLIIDMLAGRLEIFPILMLFNYSAWKKN